MLSGLGPANNLSFNEMENQNQPAKYKPKKK